MTDREKIFAKEWTKITAVCKPGKERALSSSNINTDLLRWKKTYYAMHLQWNNLDIMRTYKIIRSTNTFFPHCTSIINLPIGKYLEMINTVHGTEKAWLWIIPKLLLLFIIVLWQFMSLFNKTIKPCRFLLGFSRSRLRLSFCATLIPMQAHFISDLSTNVEKCLKFFSLPTVLVLVKCLQPSKISPMTHFESLTNREALS